MGRKHVRAKPGHRADIAQMSGGCSAVQKTSEKVTALTKLCTLHSGECEALDVCMEFPGSLLLTDDTAARLNAKTLHIRAHGSLGLLIRAIRRDQLSTRQVVMLLQQIPSRSGLHIRPGLLADIIRQDDESPDVQSLFCVF